MTNSLLRLAAVVPALAAAESVMSGPVAQVRKLLENMLADKQAEATEDQDMQKKLDCWATTSRETAEAIVQEATKTNAEAVALMTASAEGKAAAEENIKIYTKNKEEIQKALDAAHVEQRKANELFQAEHGEEVSDIKALEQAIAAIEKSHTGASLAQKKETVLFARRLVKSIMYRHGSGELASSQAVTAFLAEEAEPEDAQTTVSGIDPSTLNAPGMSSYDAQSGGIVGILKQIQANLENDMGQAYTEYKKAEEAYTGQVKTYNEQLELEASRLLTAEENLAKHSKDNIKAKAIIGDSQNKLDESIAFLKELDMHDETSKQEAEERTKNRKEEMEALQKAIEILSSDENRELFGKTTGKKEVSFLQLARTSFVSRRNEAARALTQVSAKTKSKTLSAVAAAIRVSTRGEGSTKEKILGLIDTTVADLKTSMANDVKTRDSCKKKFQANDVDTLKNTEEQNSFNAEIDVSEKKLAQNEEEVLTLSEENEALKRSILQASQNREDENGEFQTAIQDNRKALKVLNQVKAELGKVYGEKDAALLQSKSSSEAPEGIADKPQGPAAYTKHSGADGVDALLSKIIADTETFLAEAMSTEQEAQAAYVAFVQDSTASFESNDKMIETLKRENIETEAGKQDIEADLKDAKQQAADLQTDLQNLHAECDFLVENFDLRQDNFRIEIDGLTAAKQTLQGAKLD